MKNENGYTASINSSITHIYTITGSSNHASSGTLVAQFRFFVDFFADFFVAFFGASFFPKRFLKKPPFFSASSSTQPSSCSRTTITTHMLGNLARAHRTCELGLDTNTVELTVKP
eukprot:8157953-Pyramimonas_sp.AAC.1